MSQRPSDRAPRWVKVLGIIIIVMILLVAVMLVTGVGGPHGPGRHIPLDSSGGVPPTHGTTGVILSGDGVAGFRPPGGGPG